MQGRILYRRNESREGHWEVKRDADKAWRLRFDASVNEEKVRRSLNISHPKLKAVRFRSPADAERAAET